MTKDEQLLLFTSRFGLASWSTTFEMSEIISIGTQEKPTACIVGQLY